MASTYPGAVDTFTTKTDNVDAILASHVNELQNSIVAVETELGVDPAGGSTNLVTRLKGLGDANASTSTSTSSNQTLTDASNGLHFVTPGAAIDYTLPAVGSANHPFVISNRSGTYTITVKNASATVIGYVLPYETHTFVSNSNAWVDAMQRKVIYGSFEVFAPATDCATGDSKKLIHILPILNNHNLCYVHAFVGTAGTTNTMDIQIRNKTDTQDMLSTKLTIDSTEVGSDTAATPAVIDTTKDDVITNDVLAIDVDAIHTTAAKGLVVTLGFISQ